MPSVAIKRRLFAALPTPVRVQGRAYFRNCLLDLREYVTGQGERDIPPHRLNISGGGPFRLYGETTVAACREYARLKADDRFIDIGCGIGRTALALTGFLHPSTSYLGFDVIEFAVRWCSRHISNRYENFRFVHSDVHNWVYNPRGRTSPQEYRFPASDSEFQFALANSLFTHLGPNAVDHYISEAARVLAKAGRFLSSWFVLDHNAQSNGTAVTRFPHRIGPAGYASLHAPEQAVGFERDWIEQAFRIHGFSVEAIHKGNWSGLEGAGKTFQDLVVAVKG